MKILFLTLSLVFAASGALAQSASWKVEQSCEHIPEELKLKLDVEIREPLAQSLDAFIASCPQLKTLELRLNSPGGSIYEARNIVDVLDKAKERGVTLITRVDNGDECDSSCVPLFAQGHQRQAGAVAAFMFHGVAAYVISNVPIAKDTEEMLKLIRRGVNASWLKGLQDLGVFTEPSMYWLSGQELVDQNSGLVTELLTRHNRIRPYDRSYRAL